MNPRFRKYLAAFYVMIGRSDMSRFHGDFSRARIQLLAASRLWECALKSKS